MSQENIDVELDASGAVREEHLLPTPPGPPDPQKVINLWEANPGISGLPRVLSDDCPIHSRQHSIIDPREQLSPDPSENISICCLCTPNSPTSPAYNDPEVIVELIDISPRRYSSQRSLEQHGRDFLPALPGELYINPQRSPHQYKRDSTGVPIDRRSVTPETATTSTQVEPQRSTERKQVKFIIVESDTSSLQGPPEPQDPKLLGYDSCRYPSPILESYDYPEDSVDLSIREFPVTSLEHVEKFKEERKLGHYTHEGSITPEGSPKQYEREHVVASIARRSVSTEQLTTPPQGHVRRSVSPQSQPGTSQSPVSKKICATSPEVHVRRSVSPQSQPGTSQSPVSKKICATSPEVHVRRSVSPQSQPGTSQSPVSKKIRATSPEGHVRRSVSPQSQPGTSQSPLGKEFPATSFEVIEQFEAERKRRGSREMELPRTSRQLLPRQLYDDSQETPEVVYHNVGERGLRRSYSDQESLLQPLNPVYFLPSPRGLVRSASSEALGRTEQIPEQHVLPGESEQRSPSQLLASGEEQLSSYVKSDRRSSNLQDSPAEMRNFRSEDEQSLERQEHHGDPSGVESQAVLQSCQVEQLQRENKRWLTTKVLAFLVFISIVAGFFCFYGLTMHLTQPPSSSPESAVKRIHPTNAALELHINDFVDFRQNPCDNFYSFACGKYHQTIGNKKRENFHMLAAKKKRDAIKNLFTGDFKTQPIWKSHQNLQTFYTTCASLTIMARKDEMRYLDLIRSVTDTFSEEKQHNETRKIKQPTWDRVTLNAREYGFDHSFFINVSAVPVGEDSIILQVSPPCCLIQYNYAWNDLFRPKLRALVSIWGKYTPEEIVATADFAMSLQTIALQDVPAPDYESEVSSADETNFTFDWKKFLRSLTGEADLELDEVTGYLEVTPYIIKLRELLSKTKPRIWLNYVNIMMVLHDCRYLPFDWRVICLSDFTLIDIKNSSYLDEFCLKTTRESPWFNSVAEANHIALVTSDPDFDIRSILVEDVFNMTKQTINEWLYNHPLLSLFSTIGIFEHLNSLQLSLGWSHPNFNMDFFEQMHNTSTADLPQTTLVEMAHVMRKTFFDEQLTRTRMPPKFIQAYWNSKPSEELINFVNYEKRTHTLVVEVDPLQLILKSIDIPQYELYATLGTWMATAMIRIFNQTEFKKDDCIEPASMWKYSIQVYREESICLKKQYRLYQSSFKGFYDNNTLSTNIGNLSVITASTFAYLAYNKWNENEDNGNLEEYELKGFQFTAEQLYWIISMTYRCEIEEFSEYEKLASSKDNSKPPERIPSFLTLGPYFISKPFWTSFNCHQNDRMVPDIMCQF